MDTWRKIERYHPAAKLSVFLAVPNLIYFISPDIADCVAPDVLFTAHHITGIRMHQRNAGTDLSVPGNGRLSFTDKSAIALRTV
jgi:hypothetical protein